MCNSTLVDLTGLMVGFLTSGGRKLLVWYKFNGCIEEYFLSLKSQGGSETEAVLAASQYGVSYIQVIVV